MEQKLIQNKQYSPNTQKNLLTESKEVLKPIILETIELKEKFPLQITQEVWDQIKYLCSEIYEVEWSGTLFYETEGEFGNPDFKCITKYILPMNMGSKAYTEFETGTDSMEFLMDNPQYLNCKQGLIHSHNTFNVFFSGQDHSEIRDNSEHHNYYLSLIVNNKGETCAKIASRGEMDEEKIQNFTYTSENGEKKTGNLRSQSKRQVVFLYNCDIITPELKVDDFFKKKTQEIIVKESEERAKKALEVSKTTFRQPYSNQSYNELFIPTEKKNWNIQQNTLFDWTENDLPVERNVVKIKLNSREKQIAEFLNTWIPGIKEDFQDSLHEIKRDFRKMSQEEYETQLEIFQEQMEECFFDCYNDFFNDPKNESVGETLQECADLLNRFTDNNEIADELHTLVVGMKEELEIELSEQFTSTK